MERNWKGARNSQRVGRLDSTGPRNPDKAGQTYATMLVPIFLAHTQISGQTLRPTSDSRARARADGSRRRTVPTNSRRIHCKTILSLAKFASLASRGR